MSKKIDEQEQKAIEEYLSSIPEQLAEDDDEHLAQKGLSYLQSQNQMPVGDVLIKNRKRNAVVISLAVLVLLVCICTPLIVLTRENPDKAVLALSDIDKELITMLMDGFNQEAIALSLGMTQPAVSQRIKKIRGIFQKYL